MFCIKNTLLRVLCLKNVLCLRLIPESPRWLMSQKNSAKALEIAKAMAKENKKKLSNDFEVNRFSSFGELMFNDLFEYPNLFPFSH